MQIRFGDFVLDVETRELFRGDTVVALSPKAFQLLGILVTRRPKAISRAELQDELWPDTYVVEKNLTNLIAEIREALGDDAAQPKFVRTIQRFGYAFRDDPKPPVAGPAAVPVAPQCRLSWVGGRAILGPGEHVIGRSPDVEVYVDAVSVSRRHACLRVADVVTIVDLESKNGTFVDGTRVTVSRPLTNGDEIRLGSCNLTYHVLGPEIPTDTW